MTEAMNEPSPDARGHRGVPVHEAELLDTWRLPEWAELYTDDARYDVTSLSLDDPATASSAGHAVHSRRRQGTAHEPCEAAHEEIRPRGVSALEDAPHDRQRARRRAGERRRPGSRPTSSCIAPRATARRPTWARRTTCWSRAGWPDPDPAQAVHPRSQQPRRPGTSDHHSLARRDAVAARDRGPEESPCQSTFAIGNSATLR